MSPKVICVTWRWRGRIWIHSCQITSIYTASGPQLYGPASTAVTCVCTWMWCACRLSGLTGTLAGEALLTFNTKVGSQVELLPKDTSCRSKSLQFMASIEMIRVCRLESRCFHLMESTPCDNGKALPSKAGRQTRLILMTINKTFYVNLPILNFLKTLQFQQIMSMICNKAGV